MKTENEMRAELATLDAAILAAETEEEQNRAIAAYERLRREICDLE